VTTTYYLSGPMRSKPDYNREVFNAVETALAESFGMSEYDPAVEDAINPAVINPVKNFGGDTDLSPSVHLTLDFKQVLEADVIVQLPGWQTSEGARREAQLALWAGKRFVKATESVGPSDVPYWYFEDIDGPELSESVRAQACDEGKQLITGDRNNSYGPPWQDFQRTADAMTAYGYRHTQLPASAPPCPTCGARPIRSHDTAIMIDCVKTSRLMWTPTKRDSWVDKIGYAGCGLECALHDDELKRELTA
jgi:hypothetical protein